MVCQENHPSYPVNRIPNLEVLDIKITNGGSKLEAKYYTNSGSIKDQFSITKLNSGSNSNPFTSGTSSSINPFSAS